MEEWKRNTSQGKYIKFKKKTNAALYQAKCKSDKKRFEKVMRRAIIRSVVC